MTDVHLNTWWIVAITFTALLIGTVIRVVALRGSDSSQARRQRGSLRAWWIVAMWVILAAMVGMPFAAAMFCLVSCFAFREFSEMIRPQPLDVDVRWCALAVIAVTYLLVGTGGGMEVLLTVPLAGSLEIGCWLVVSRRLATFTPHVSGVLYGLALTTSLPAFALLILRPDELDASTNDASYFLILIGLTEVNDIASAIIGRRWGRHALAVDLSPHKTTEGMIGGMIVTVLLATVAGLTLVPWGFPRSLVVGFMIALAGTLGDLNMSAVKRCAKVKDSSDLIPGQGGVLDRIDSLTFTAPAFFLLLHWMR